MWGAKPPPKRGAWGKAPSLGSVCVYILILPTQNPVIFSNLFLEKYTSAAISEEEKVSCFSIKKVIKIIKTRLQGDWLLTNID